MSGLDIEYLKHLISRPDIGHSRKQDGRQNGRLRGSKVIFPILTRYPNTNMSGYEDFLDIGRPDIDT
jgi:hypothetical protein